MSGTEQTGFSRVGAHIFLVFILCLLVFSVVFLVYRIRKDAHELDHWDTEHSGEKYTNAEHSGEKYTNVVVVLLLLFNHIAFQYTKTGWPSKVMKTIAFSWLAFGMIYIAWVIYLSF